MESSPWEKMNGFSAFAPEAARKRNMAMGREGRKCIFCFGRGEEWWSVMIGRCELEICEEG